MDEIATVFNAMTDRLALVTSEVTRVAQEVGTEGKLGGQAEPVQPVLRDQVRRPLMGDLGGQFGDARARFAGQPGELALGVSRRAAKLLHQHAPGQILDGTGPSLGAQEVKLAPLPGDQGGQPGDLGIPG